MSNNATAVTGQMTEKERLSELKRLRNSYAMYEKAKVEMVENRKNMKDQLGNTKYAPSSIDSTMDIMDTMQKDIVEQYILLGGTEDDIKSVNIEDNLEDVNTEEVVEDIPTKVNIGEGVMEYLQSINDKNTDDNTTYTTYKSVADFDVSSIKEQFDMIPLPSHGEAYANKISSIPVSYLTAYDENIIVSPNLYRDGSFLDVLLKNKVLNPAIDVNNLLPGDRDAIILWLRATGYGNEFPVTVTDDQTGKEFNTTIDLSTIEYKEFNLKGDENGWFEYTLPVSKDKIKFSFLTYGENEALAKKDKEEDISIKREELMEMSERITSLKKNTLANTFNKKFAKRIDDATQTLEDWYDNITVENKTKISHSLTNRLIKMVKSINGVTDKNFIKEYIVKMNIRDSSSLRRYILDNEPGLDFNITVERPQSLGGGSMTTFLTLDQFIFLNIA